MCAVRLWRIPVRREKPAMSRRSRSEFRDLPTIFPLVSDFTSLISGNPNSFDKYISRFKPMLEGITHRAQKSPPGAGFLMNS